MCTAGNDECLKDKEIDISERNLDDVYCQPRCAYKMEDNNYLYYWSQTQK